MFVLGIIVVFLLIREILTWYWKINRIVALLEKIEKNTRSGGMAKETAPAADASSSDDKPENVSEWWNGKKDK